MNSDVKLLVTNEREKRATERSLAYSRDRRLVQF